MPAWMLSIIHKIPSVQLRRLQNYIKVARGVAKSIVDRQIRSQATGKDASKDVMSALGESPTIQCHPVTQTSPMNQ
jgi:hypothetical protein